MLLDDFIYEWDGKSQKGEEPISWWPGSYHVRIIRFSDDTSNISMLMPDVVLLKNARTKPEMMNTSLRNYIHTFARKIAAGYDLDVFKTLWVEIDDEIIRATRIKPGHKAIDARLFDVSWRNIRPNELEMIQPYLEDM